MFAALPTGMTLKAGESYTYTYDDRRLFQTTFMSTIEDAINKTVTQFGKVIVDRPFGSNHIVITVKPSKDSPEAYWKAALNSSLDNAGLPDAVFLDSEEGTESSIPGGLTQGLTELGTNTASGVSKVLWSTVKPLLPWIILIGGSYIGFQVYLAKKMGGK